ncbi:MAG: PorP/SprF family type IX secretion system membrane protein [Saprospiraceae bacterium]
MRHKQHKLCWVFSLLILVTSFAYAQQEIILTKYTYNALLFNPAYAGSHGFGGGTAILQYRNQWLGLKGAPTTILAAAESSFADDRIGLGFTVGRESVGIDTRNDLSINYAYQMELGKGHLCVGFRTSWSQYLSNFSGLVNVDINDPVYAQPEVTISLFAVGAGMYYNTRNAYVGIAIPAVKVVESTSNGTFGSRHIYFHTGMMMGDENATINVEPSVLMAYQKAAPIQMTLGLNVWYDQKYAIGAYIRSQDAFALSTEVFLQEHYRFSLAYDFTISDLQKYSNGTVELMMAYHFYTKPEIKRIKNIRYGGRF